MAQRQNQVWPCDISKLLGPQHLEALMMSNCCLVFFNGDVLRLRRGDALSTNTFAQRGAPPAAAGQAGSADLSLARKRTLRWPRSARDAIALINARQGQAT